MRSNPPLPPVVFGIDDCFAEPLCVAFKSLARCSADCLGEIRVVVLFSELSFSAQNAVQAAAGTLGISLRMVRVPPIPPYAATRWPPSTYLRLGIAEYLPDEPAALYLDADILVLASLRPLLSTHLESSCLGAVRDPLSPTVAEGGVLPGWKELGLAANTPYFNAGVLLMNLDAWRSHQIAESSRTLLQKHPEYVSHPDQDALNVVTRDLWTPMDSSWNAFAASALAEIGWLDFDDDGSRRRELLGEERRARLLHFAGPKPWQPGFPVCAALDLYRQYAESS